jgi:hypothetical protein
MGYYAVKKYYDSKKEREDLESQARKKSLWSSIGGTALGLIGGAFTGGLAPILKGLVVGGSTLLGRALGSKTAGDIEEGIFWQADREQLQDRFDPFGSENITQSLKAGVTAGMMSKLFGPKVAGKPKSMSGMGTDAVPNLTKEPLSASDNWNLDKITKIKPGPQIPTPTSSSAEISKGLKNYQFGPSTPEDTTTGYFRDEDIYDWSGDVGDIGTTPSAADIQQSQRKAMDQFLSKPENRMDYGKALYQEGSVLGDDITKDIMSKYADPSQSYQASKESLFDKLGSDIKAQSHLKLAKRGANLRRPDPDMPSFEFDDTQLTKGEHLRETAFESYDKPQFYRDAEGNIVDNVNQSWREVQEYNAANRIKDPGFTQFDEASWARSEEVLRGIDKDLRVQDLQRSLNFQDRLNLNRPDISGLQKYLSGYRGVKK